MIGIPGVPDDLSVSPTWFRPGRCATPPRRVAAASGRPSPPSRGALPGWTRRSIRPTQAILGTHHGHTYPDLERSARRRRSIDRRSRSASASTRGSPGRWRSPTRFSMPSGDRTPPYADIPGCPKRPSQFLPGLGGGPCPAVPDSNGRASGFYTCCFPTACRGSRVSSPICCTADSQGQCTRSWCRPTKLVDIPRSGSSTSASIRRPGWSSSIPGPIGDPRRLAETVHRPASHRQRRQRPRAAGPQPWTPLSCDWSEITAIPNRWRPTRLDAARCSRLRGVHQNPSDTRESLLQVSLRGVRYGIEWDQKRCRSWASTRGAPSSPPGRCCGSRRQPGHQRATALLARDTIGTGGGGAVSASDQRTAGR